MRTKWSISRERTTVDAEYNHTFVGERAWDYCKAAKAKAVSCLDEGESELTVLQGMLQHWAKALSSVWSVEDDPIS